MRTSRLAKSFDKWPTPRVICSQALSWDQPARQRKVPWSLLRYPFLDALVCKNGFLVHILYSTSTIEFPSHGDDVLQNIQTFVHLLSIPTDISPSSIQTQDTACEFIWTEINTVFNSFPLKRWSTLFSNHATVTQTASGSVYQSQGLHHIRISTFTATESVHEVGG